MKNENSTEAQLGYTLIKMWKNIKKKIIIRQEK